MARINRIIVSALISGLIIVFSAHSALSLSEKPYQTISTKDFKAHEEPLFGRKVYDTKYFVWEDGFCENIRFGIAEDTLVNTPIKESRLAPYIFISRPRSGDVYFGVEFDYYMDFFPVPIKLLLSLPEKPKITYPDYDPKTNSYLYKSELNRSAARTRYLWAINRLDSPGQYTLKIYIENRLVDSAEFEVSIFGEASGIIGRDRMQRDSWTGGGLTFNGCTRNLLYYFVLRDQRSDVMYLTYTPDKSVTMRLDGKKDDIKKITMTFLLPHPGVDEYTIVRNSTIYSIMLNNVFGERDDAVQWTNKAISGLIGSRSDYKEKKFGDINVLVQYFSDFKRVTVCLERKEA